MLALTITARTTLTPHNGRFLVEWCQCQRSNSAGVCGGKLGCNSNEGRGDGRRRSKPQGL